MNETPDVVIYGAGGHGKVVLDAALSCGCLRVVGLVDDEPGNLSRHVLGIEVVGEGAWLTADRLRRYKVVVAIGDNSRRAEIVRQLTALGAAFASVIHPTAHLARNARVGQGSMILPMAVLHTDAKVGRHAIVNTGAILEHDTVVGDFAHVASGACLAGGAHVGEAVLVGTGASVLPNIRIGEGATVAAGAVVIHDVAAHTVVAGVPALPFGPVGDH
jgi:sugar O-acyltransferase (sialic acid O-acetyltransferase NeuD family)